MSKSSAFSMSEALVTLGLIGILVITMISMNNFAGYNSKEAIIRLSQVDSALQTWGKALSQSNETGMGVTANIGSQKNLNDSFANFFNNRGKDADVTLKTDASVGETLNGATKFTLDNGVELSVKYLGQMNTNGVTLNGADPYSRNDSLSNIAYVTASVQDKKASYAQEYVVNEKGLESADAQFEGWAKYKVNRDMYIIGKDGEKITVVGYCISSECQAGGECGVGCTRLNDDFEGEYIYENTTGTEPCPSGETGSIVIKQIGTIAGVYDFKDNQCCAAPKIRVNGQCDCPDKAAMTIKAGWGYAPNEATCQRQCASGEYSLNGICTLCTEANYCPNTGMTSPFECQAGHYCPNYAQNENKSDYNPSVYSDGNGDKADPEEGGLITEKECQPGTYQPDKNQLSCKPCEQGYYCPDSGMTKQIPCPAGTYYDTEMLVTDPEHVNTSAVCKPCPVNTYNPNPAATSIKECKTCPNGSWTEDVGATTCTTCPTGTLFDATNQQCVPCPIGHYCPNPGMKVGEEIACECGYYQPKTGQTECLLVPAGTYPTINGKDYVKIGATKATLCPVGHKCAGSCNNKQQCNEGYFQKFEGKAECTPCDKGYFQSQKGQDKCEQCKCGEYNPYIGQSKCYSCGSKYNPTYNAVSENSCTVLSGKDYVSQDNKCCYVHYYTTYVSDGQTCTTVDGIETCTTKFKAVENTQLICPGDTPRGKDNEPIPTTTQKCVLSCNPNTQMLDSTNCACIDNPPPSGCPAGQYVSNIYKVKEGAQLYAGTTTSAFQIDNSTITFITEYPSTIKKLTYINKNGKSTNSTCSSAGKFSGVYIYDATEVNNKGACKNNCRRQLTKSDLIIASTECLACPCGTVSAGGSATTCSVCFANQYAPRGSSTCSFVPDSKYQPTGDKCSYQCKPCPTLYGCADGKKGCVTMYCGGVQATIGMVQDKNTCACSCTTVQPTCAAGHNGVNFNTNHVYHDSWKRTAKFTGGGYECIYYNVKGNTPLILDLKDNGYNFTDDEHGVMFDLNGDGIIDQTGWTNYQTEFDDAFVVLDKNKNGQIDNGKELFGDQNGAETGFDELAKYDDNKDGKITPKDKAYNELRLWCDMNKNAKVDSGELRTFAEERITELSTSYKMEYDKDGNIKTDANGNITGLVGTFKHLVEIVVNGAKTLVEKVGTMIDVIFQMISGS